MSTAPESSHNNEEPLAPPPLPESESVALSASTVATFIASRFWWIIAGAALVKLVAYFIAPQPPSTFGGHIGGILRGFTVFGVTLAIVAGLVCLFFKAKARIFRIAFAILFALACLLNLPSACLLRHAYSKAHSAAAQFAAATYSFEALMQYESNPIVGRHTGLAAKMTGQREGTTYRKPVNTDAQKYFNLSYCYATGFDGYPRDMHKAIQLCQKAASEPISYYPEDNRVVVKRAQELLTKSGLSWQKEKK